MKKGLFIFSMIVSHFAFSQIPAITGNIIDSGTNQPVEGVTVNLIPGKSLTMTNAAGNFTFTQSSLPVTAISVSAIGYVSKTIPMLTFHQNKNMISLETHPIELSTVTISSRAGDQFKIISKIDIAMRNVSNSQEVLRLVPGLFIGQHQGGGKAEQIFLRGFDCDHGTDISLNTDNINMVS